MTDQYQFNIFITKLVLYNVTTLILLTSVRLVSFYAPKCCTILIFCLRQYMACFNSVSCLHQICLHLCKYLSIYLIYNRRKSSYFGHNQKHKDYQTNAHFYIWSKNLSSKQISRFFSSPLVDYIIIYHNYLNNVLS